MIAVSYITGEHINGIEFIKEVAPHFIRGRALRKAMFKCSCGRFFECVIRSIISGNTKSCGCYGAKSRSDRFKKHGLRNHPLYGIWCGIKTRCYNKNRSDYKYYGGRGIILSEEFHSFLVWYEYVISLSNYSERVNLKLTIDRIIVTKNYERGNLKWSTRKQQSLNQLRNSDV